MTTGCVTNAALTSGSDLTGLNFTAGSAGTAYYVTVTANASSGYLASGTSPVAGPQVDTSRVNAPGTPTGASSGTTAGAVTATFTASSGTAPTSYTAKACTDAAMTLNCVTQAAYSTGAQFTGLTQGTSYYLQIIANPPVGYASATSATSAGTVLATTQLNTPAAPTLTYGATAGSINVVATTNGPGGQTYTVKACTNLAMTTGCVTSASLVSGSDLTGLAFSQGAAGTAYYVTATANSSVGYLASGTSAPGGPQADTSRYNAPGTPTVAPSATTAGAVTATFTAPSGVAPTSYSAAACTNAAMTTGCVTVSNYTSGAQLTGLTGGTSYWVQITAAPSSGFAASASGTSASSALATSKLNAPTITNSSTAFGGTLSLTFTGSSNAPGGQTYTAVTCTDAAMTQNCVTVTNYTSGATISGLNQFTNYYATITAVGSTGYLPTTSAVYGPRFVL